MEMQIVPSDLRQINFYRFEKKWTLLQLNEYIRKRHKIKIDTNKLHEHVTTHCIDKELNRVIMEDADHPEVITTLQPLLKREMVQKTTDDITKAFDTLVKMTHTYTERISKIQDQIEIAIEKKDIGEEIKGMSAIELLEKISKLNREAREQVKDISQLRAPKIMVAQFLESFMNDLIREIGTILSNLCGDLQLDIVDRMKLASISDHVTASVFTPSFQKAAKDFMDRMLKLRRQKMVEATEALTNLEKIV
jgi:hypothetical protein